MMEIAASVRHAVSRSWPVFLKSWSSEQCWRQSLAIQMHAKYPQQRAACHGQQASASALIRVDDQALLIWHLLWLVSMLCGWRPVSHRFLFSNGQVLANMAAATARRQCRRHCIGRVRDQFVSPKTLSSYNTARFFSFVLRSHPSHLGDSMALDAFLCGFDEQMWECGDPKGWPPRRGPG